MKAKKKNLYLVIINFVVIVVVTMFDVIYYKDFFDLYGMYVGSALLALITLIFVRKKYNDKEARGTK